MSIGIMGSGQVAQVLAARLLELGRDVMISSRDTSQAKDRSDWGLIPSADGFVAGNDREARDWVHQELLARWLGWAHELDLGDIVAARATEMYLPLWLRLWGAAGTTALNIKVVAGM